MAVDDERRVGIDRDLSEITGGGAPGERGQPLPRGGALPVSAAQIAQELCSFHASVVRYNSQVAELVESVKAIAEDFRAHQGEVVEHLQRLVQIGEQNHRTMQLLGLQGQAVTEQVKRRADQGEETM